MIRSNTLIKDQVVLNHTLLSDQISRCDLMEPSERNGHSVMESCGSNTHLATVSDPSSS